MVYRAFFYFIPPYGVYGRCIIFGPMVYRAFLFLLFRHTVYMVGLCSLALWCTGHFLFYSPYGVNGRCTIFGPMVYRAF